MSNLFKEILNNLPQKEKNFDRLSAGIAAKLRVILNEKGILQKEFAERLEKKESEISKWLSGDHNFTLKSVARIEAELDTQLLYTEFDLEDIKAKLDKGQRYVALYENLKDDVFRDTFKCIISIVGNNEQMKKHMQWTKYKIFSVGDFCDYKRSNLVANYQPGEEKFFEPLKELIE